MEGERCVPAGGAAAGSGGMGEGVIEACEGHTSDLRREKGGKSSKLKGEGRQGEKVTGAFFSNECKTLASAEGDASSCVKNSACMQMQQQHTVRKECTRKHAADSTVWRGV